MTAPSHRQSWHSDISARAIARQMRRLSSQRARARKLGALDIARRLSGRLAELAPALRAAKQREREQTAEQRSAEPERRA